MPFVDPYALCDICQNLDILTRDLPYEDEDAIPHQQNLVALQESAQPCPLCYQVTMAIAMGLGWKDGKADFITLNIDGTAVSARLASANFRSGGGKQYEQWRTAK